MANPSNNGSGRSPRPPRLRRDFQAQIHATRAEIRSHVKATRAQLDHANQKIRARTGRNLVLAVLIGLALGGVILVSLIVVKELFIVVAGILFAFTAFELASSLRCTGCHVPRIPTVIVTLGIFPATYFWGAFGQLCVLFGGVIFLVLWQLAEYGSARIFRRRKPSTPSSVTRARRSFAPTDAPPPGSSVFPRNRVGIFLRDIGASIFVQIYIAFLGSFTVLLTAQNGGEWWTVAFVILVIATDTGAYASGVLFGKHPLAPAISPTKTWEGFIGGALFTVFAGILLSIFMLEKPWWFGILFALVLFATATMGDLTESLIKRDLGIKDMSSWLPGHGGFLDRFDSILPSAAAAYTLFLLFS